MSKYRNVPTVAFGITFDSKREAARYTELKLMQRAGQIGEIFVQVPFELAPSVKIFGEKRARPAMKYTADFVYYRNAGIRVVEDVKGFRGDTAFRIRQHLMKSVHNIDVRLT